MENITFAQLTQLCAVILVLLGAYNLTMTAVKTHREEKRLKDSPYQQMKERLDRHDQLLARDMDRLDTHEKDIDLISQESRIMLRGVRALLSHEVNGNSDDRLKASLTEIDDYLISRK